MNRRQRPGQAAALRARAARAVHAVSGRGRSLDEALSESLPGDAEVRDRGLYRALVYGTLRWLPRSRIVTARLLTRPLRSRDRVLEDLIATGLFQLDHMRLPPHAAVKETVAATRTLGRPGAAGLVNAVLRRYQRERDRIHADLSADPVYRWAHPAWLVDRLAADWPRRWEEILAANNVQAPMWLRVNQLRADPGDWAARLRAGGDECDLAPQGVAESVRLASPRDVAALPGFAGGEISVQDGAAQLAAGLLAPGTGDRVLDACAAPGGKTTHLLERYPGIRMTALDASADRVERIRENLARLGLEADVRVADAGQEGAWCETGPFDRILLDVPCSGTGVIRRHPDIKLLRRAADLPALVAGQARLLDALWSRLRPGGRLVYSTCSVIRAENAERVAAFLERHADARAEPISADWGFPDGPGRQILPGETGMDGFYYACLHKSDDGPIM